jgi:hypothetical protein
MFQNPTRPYKISGKNIFKDWSKFIFAISRNMKNNNNITAPSIRPGRGKT